MMSRYEAFDLRSQVMGQMVLSMTRSILHSEIEGILKRNGMDKIDPKSWYPVQCLMDVFNEVSENTSEIFVSIGMGSARMSLESMPQMNELPFHTFFANFDSVWQSRHRNGDVGHLLYQRIDDNHLTLTIRSPYPDDIFYGAFYAYTRHFRPKNRDFKVFYDPQIPTREHGGEATIIHIQLI